MPIWNATSCDLNCIPAVPEHISLPWDAADELLVSFKDHLPIEAAQPSLIIGDRYGALSTAYADTLVHCDSMSAALAINKNRLNNDLPSAHIEHDLEIAFQSAKLTQDNKDNISGSDNLILARFPKQFEVLGHYLHLCSNYGFSIGLAGMHKHLPVRWLKWLEDNSLSYFQSRITKKARIVFLTPRTNIDTPKITSYQLNNFELKAEPGVYGRETADPGALALLPHLPKNKQGRIADLGCGNGILSITTKLNCPQAEVIGIDDSYVAIKSASNNGYASEQSITWLHSDIFQRADGKFDYIICNPPFHDGHKLSQNIAVNMFRQSAERLNKGGNLLVVANRHLPYLKTLKQLFNVKSLNSSDQRFSIYCCKK